MQTLLLQYANSQFSQLKKDDIRTNASASDDGDPRYFEFSDATLQVLNSNYNILTWY